MLSIITYKKVLTHLFERYSDPEIAFMFCKRRKGYSLLVHNMDISDTHIYHSKKLKDFLKNDFIEVSCITTNAVYLGVSKEFNHINKFSNYCLITRDIMCRGTLTTTRYNKQQQVVDDACWYFFMSHFRFLFWWKKPKHSYAIGTTA